MDLPPPLLLMRTSLRCRHLCNRRCRHLCYRCACHSLPRLIPPVRACLRRSTPEERTGERLNCVIDALSVADETVMMRSLTSDIVHLPVVAYPQGIRFGTLPFSVSATPMIRAIEEPAIEPGTLLQLRGRHLLGNEASIRLFRRAVPKELERRVLSTAGGNEQRLVCPKRDAEGQVACTRARLRTRACGARGASAHEPVARAAPPHPAGSPIGCVDLTWRIPLVTALHSGGAGRVRPGRGAHGMQDGAATDRADRGAVERHDHTDDG